MTAKKSSKSKSSKPKRATLPLSIRLPAELVRRVEAIAERDITSVTSIVGRALNLFVEKDRAAAEGHAAYIAKLTGTLNTDAALETLYAVAEQASNPAGLRVATPETSGDDDDEREPIISEKGEVIGSRREALGTKKTK